MPDPQARKERRERQHREAEDNQRDLRDSIERTKQLVDDSDEILKRHRGEWEAEDEAT